MHRKRIDALDALSSDSSSDDDNEEKQPKPPAHKKAKPTIALEDLKKHGYREGASVLLMPEQRKEADNNWAWATGNTRERRKGEADAEETADERERNRQAATTGAEEQAKYATKVMENAVRIKEERRAEELRLRAERRRGEKKKSGGNNNRDDMR